jgi:WD40 repeat protein
MRIDAHTNGVCALAFSPDRSLLASAGDPSEQVIKLWNPTGGSLVRILAGHTNGTAALAFSPDSSLLASGGQNRDLTIKLWDVATGACRTIPAHAGGVRALAFNRTGAWLASAGRKDGWVKVWRTDDAALVASLSGLAQGAQSVAFSPDGTVLGAAGSDRLQFWQTSGWLPVWSYTNELSRVSAFDFSPNAKYLLVGREDGAIGRLVNPLASLPLLRLAWSALPPGPTSELTLDNPGYSRFVTVQTSSNLVRVTDPWASDGTRFYRASAPE